MNRYTVAAGQARFVTATIDVKALVSTNKGSTSSGWSPRSSELPYALDLDPLGFHLSQVVLSLLDEPALGAAAKSFGLL